jgi:hypothetical protein
MAHKQQRRPARGDAATTAKQKPIAAKDTGKNAADQEAFAALSMASGPHRVGLGYSIEFTLSAGRFDALWTPHIPHARDQRRVCVKYEAARDKFLAEIARRTGGPVVAVEVPA